jgi:hypothetical protein
VRAAEPGQEEPVVGRLAKAGPFEVQQRRHAPVGWRTWGGGRRH